MTDMKLCPVCKKKRDCVELDVGFLIATYRCKTCDSEFERDTLLKSAGGLVIGTIGLLLGGMFSDNKKK